MKQGGQGEIGDLWVSRGGMGREKEESTALRAVDVQVLNRRRNDTNSAPQQVIELLEEYLRLRQSGKDSLIEDIPSSFIEKYGVKFIESFINDGKNITKKQQNEFISDLLKIGYDINYRKFLQKYNSDIEKHIQN